MLHEDFIDFLKENNAFMDYMRNAGYVSEAEIDIHDTYLEAFDWEESPEGFDYWNDLDTGWFEYKCV